MGLEEESVGTGRGGGREQRWNELPLPAAGSAFSLPRLLHRMGGVEDHRRAGGLPQADEVAHVHHQVAVAEEGASLGDRNLGCTRRCAPSRPRPASLRPAIHWPFLMFTGFPVRPAATSRSVWRQRNAGIWSTSATWATAGGLLAPRGCR